MNNTPILRTTVVITDKGKRTETNEWISYQEAIRGREERLHLDYTSYWFDKEETLESLRMIIVYTMKKIMQDHCS